MSETTPNDTALARRLFDEVFNARDIAALDELVAVDYTEHALAPFESEEPGAVDGPPGPMTTGVIGGGELRCGTSPLGGARFELELK